MPRIIVLLSTPDLNINEQCFPYGETCLFRAAKKGHKELVLLLLEHQADKDIKNFLGGDSGSGSNFSRDCN